MTLTDIEGTLNRVPFVPFDMVLENGRIFHVPHPDFLLLNASKRTAVVAEGPNYRVLNLEQVALIQFKSE